MNNVQKNNKLSRDKHDINTAFGGKKKAYFYISTKSKWHSVINVIIGY